MRAAVPFEVGFLEKQRLVAEIEPGWRRVPLVAGRYEVAAREGLVLSQCRKGHRSFILREGHRLIQFGDQRGWRNIERDILNRLGALQLQRLSIFGLDGLQHRLTKGNSWHF